jgi:hypothetical protein
VQLEDGFAIPLQPTGQFGRPSVASRRYFAFLSVSPERYAAPFVMASRVGVFPAGVAAAIALEMAAPLLAATGTIGAALALHAPLSEKSLSPQLIPVCVFVTAWVSAAVTCDHFEFAPHPPLQLLSLSSFFIELDLSWTMRTSGGGGAIGTFI